MGLAASLLVAVTACGSSSEGSAGSGGTSGEGGDAITIYSSVPLQGAGAPIGEAIVNGIQLAFEQAGYQAGGVTISYVPLDDSTAEAGSWTAEAERANAQRAVDDDSAVAYLGTFNSGAAAVSIPILNQAGMAMISPGNTAVGLTSSDPGADVKAGEPGIYYPTGVRNYARIVPRDTVQGAALAKLMATDGCTRVAVAHDQELYGTGLATNIQISSEGLGYQLMPSIGIDPDASDFSAITAGFAAAGVDCFVFAGITANGAVQLFTDVAEALPGAKLYGPDGVAESTFSNPSDGGVSAEVAARTKVTIPTLSASNYPEAGRQFFADYAARYGDADPNSFAIYGYEVGSLILDVLERATDPTDREAVRQALFETTNRSSVLGSYSIDADGDTTLTAYGVYRIEDGRFAFDSAVQ